MFITFQRELWHPHYSHGRPIKFFIWKHPGPQEPFLQITPHSSLNQNYKMYMYQSYVCTYMWKWALEWGFLNHYNYGDWIITLYIFFRCTRKIKSIIKKNKLHYVLYWSYIFLLCPCSLLLWLFLLFRILQIIIFF